MIAQAKPISFVPPPAGYDAPSGKNGELNDANLFMFLQTVVAGITSIPGTLVRPRWQKNPPTQPDRDTDWCGVGPVRANREPFPAIVHATDPDNFNESTDTVILNEEIFVLASFYGPNCESNAGLLTMGLFIEQNRDAMFLNGFGLVEVGDPLEVPQLIKEEWIRQIDVSFSVRRQKAYTYPVPNIRHVDVTVLNGSYEEDASYLARYGKLPYGIAPFEG